MTKQDIRGGRGVAQGGSRITLSRRSSLHHEHPVLLRVAVGLWANNTTLSIPVILHARAHSVAPLVTTFSCVVFG